MPSIGTELETYLKSKTSITDKIGSDKNARIYKDRAKQGVKKPYVVYESFRGSSAEHLTGITGIASNRVQIDVYADTEEESHELAELIRLAPLQMYRGPMGQTFVNNVTSDSDYDYGSTAPVQGSGKRDYWTSRDYIITHRQPIN